MQSRKPLVPSAACASTARTLRPQPHDRRATLSPKVTERRALEMRCRDRRKCRRKSLCRLRKVRFGDERVHSVFVVRDEQDEDEDKVE
jgi:hypothetical protein